MDMQVIIIYLVIPVGLEDSFCKAPTHAVPRILTKCQDKSKENEMGKGKATCSRVH